MTEAPSVSVIIPTYNRADRVPISVRSVIAQTSRPIELIVVNDGSADDTRDVLAGLETEIVAGGVTPVIIHQENRGRGGARNTGLAAATGDYIAFLDDDDTWQADKLKLQLQELNRTGANACCCYIVREQPEGDVRVPGKGKRLIRGRRPGPYIAGDTYAHLISLLVARKVCEQAGKMNETLPQSQDIEWIGRVVHHAEFCAVEEVLATNAYSSDAVSRVRGGDDLLRKDLDMEMVLDLWREHNQDKPGWDEDAWRRRVAVNYEQFVKHQLYAGNRQRAAELYEKALRLVGPCEELRKARRKMRKAAWLALFGMRVKHPRFGRFEDIRD